MFPKIPADLTTLSAAELTALADEIRAFGLTALTSTELSAEDKVAARAIVARHPEIKSLAVAAKAIEDADVAALAALQAEQVEADRLAAETAAASAAAATAAAAAADAAAAALAAEAAAKLPVTTGQATQTGPATGVSTLEYLTAFDGVAGKRAGEGFESWSDLAAAVSRKAQDVNANTSEKFTVGIVRASYPAERKLSDADGARSFNLAKFEQTELTAALCAPATPYYGMHCMNETRRPVFNSLAQFEAPRMKVSIMPSPSLSDITTGYGIWSAANEASTNATKSACQTITCGSPTEYQVYGIYRCMTIRNMLAMSYPELVEAWLNRLQAAQARLAEITLLNAMGTASTAISAPLLGYGASTTIASTLLNYLALYQETQRWDLTQNLDLWAHRWIKAALKMEIVRRRNTSGTPTSVPTDADIDRLFTNAGFDPHWFIDTPTWSDAVPNVSVGGVLSRMPANVQFLIAPKGKFALMDRGELRIGVTGNGIYRDNNSNNRNEFTFFVESFEGIVDTQNCGAHVLSIPVCWSGQQVDDIGVNCQGGDQKNYQS